MGARRIVFALFPFTLSRETSHSVASRALLLTIYKSYMLTFLLHLDILTYTFFSPSQIAPTLLILHHLGIRTWLQNKFTNSPSLGSSRNGWRFLLRAKGD